MPDTAWDQRFFNSTRGKIVLLLREAPATVEQLATALQLTDNAVRAHLAALERDRLVEQSGTVKSARRPSLQYALGPAADRLFPKAYGSVLNTLLRVLEHAMPRSELDRALRQVGQVLASHAPRARGRSLASRIDAALALVQTLGGAVTVEHAGAETHLRGRSCPLALVVRDNPQACGLLEALLEQSTGVSVREECDRSDPPHCHFVLQPRLGYR